MKKKLSILAMTLIAPAILFASPVSFLIENIENDNGKIFVGVYREGDFLKEGKILKGCVSDEKLKGDQTLVLCDLNPGKYAAAIFHDENNNAELDTNFIGIPKEGYGFTNNPKLKFGPPSFEETSFEVTDQKTLKMRVRLTY